MKLSELGLTPFKLILRSPLEGAHRTQRERQGFLLTLSDDQGRVGRGEATPLVEFSTETLTAASVALAPLAQAIRGCVVPRTCEEVEALIGELGNLASTPASRCGLESALLDLAAQHAGVTVAKMLSPSARPWIAVNALLSAPDPQLLADEAFAAVQAGYAVLKVKVANRALWDDAKRLVAVRRAVGDGVKIRIDANGAWTEAEAATALRGLSPLKLELCEQPVTAGNHAALRRLRWLVPCPIAADESVSHPGGADALLDGEDGPIADVLVLKPMALGGLLPALKLAQRAEGVGVGTYVTSAMDGVVARLGAAHLAAALPKAEWASGLGVGRMFEKDLGLDPCAPVEGRIHLPQLPGLGLPAGWGVS